jgi:hypothetical protein
MTPHGFSKFLNLDFFAQKSFVPVFIDTDFISFIHTRPSDFSLFSHPQPFSQHREKGVLVASCVARDILVASCVARDVLSFSLRERVARSAG